jgi:hypothetical protein
MDTTSTTGPPGRRSNGPKVAAIVATGLLGLFAFGLLAAGGAALWGDSQKDEHGYISSDSERYATGTRAITSENLDLDLDGVDKVIGSSSFGKVRLEVASRDGKPAFVGIARTSDVSDYLQRSAHSVVTDVDYSPFHASYSDKSGQRELAPPAGERFWAASAHGDGMQTLTWDVEDGDWSVVVMNADGSAGVDAGVSAGAELSVLDEAGWVLLGTGLLALAGAGALLYAGVRPPRRGAGGGAPAPVAAPA